MPHITQEKIICYSQSEVATSVFPLDPCSFSGNVLPRTSFQGCHLFLWACYHHEKVWYCAAWESFLAFVMWAKQACSEGKWGKSSLLFHPQRIHSYHRPFFPFNSLKRCLWSGLIQTWWCIHSAQLFFLDQLTEVLLTPPFAWRWRCWSRLSLLL